MATVATRTSLKIANDTIQLLSVTQDGASGNATSAVIVVPATVFWIVKNASVVNPDTVARACAIEVLDAAANVVCLLAGDGVTTQAQGVASRFAGHSLLGPGWSLRANVAAVGAFVPVLKFTGIEANLGLPSSVLGLN